MAEFLIGLVVTIALVFLAAAQTHLEREEDPRAGSLSLARAFLLSLAAASWLLLLASSAPFAVVLAFGILLIWFIQQALGKFLGGRKPGAKIAASLDRFIALWSKLVAPIRLTAPEEVEDYEQELIESVEDFSETVVREVMVPRVDMEVVAGDDSLEQALAVFIASGYSRLPVIGEDVDDVLGVIYLKDVARYSHQNPQQLSNIQVRDVARKPLFTPETISVAQLLQQMQRSGTQIAIVSDEYGQVAGIATIEDLLEEIVGEISDEHDRETDEIELVGDDTYRVNPRVTLDELSEHCEITLEDEDVDTVGGLLTKAVGQLPKGGEVVEHSGLVLTAERVDKRGRILSVLVRKIEVTDE
jgi:CBS domain containing-hemolysin-like protein